MSLSAGRFFGRFFLHCSGRQAFFFLVINYYTKNGYP